MIKIILKTATKNFNQLIARILIQFNFLSIFFIKKRKPLKSLFTAISFVFFLLILSNNVAAQSVQKNADIKSIEAQKAKQFAKEESDRKKNKDKYEHEEKEEGKGDGYDRPGEALEFEIERTKNPVTGRVPWEKLRTAIIETEQAKQNIANRTSALSWMERGPDGDFRGPQGNSRPTGQQTAGRIRAIIVDSLDPTHKTVIAGSVSGGLWKTTDITSATPTWTLINDFLSNLAIASICQDPRPGFQNIMYLCTGESYGNADAVRGVGAFKSMDGGATWSFLSSTSGFVNGTRILCDFQGNIYLGTRGAGLQRSTDGGTSWTNITPTGLNNDICDLRISTTGAAGRLHVTTGIFSASGYRYTDIPITVTSGSGWNTATTPFTTFSQRTELGISGNVLFACPSNSSYQVPTIWKSTDGGDNWVATTTQPSATWANGQAWFDLSVGINPSDPNQCIVGGLDLWKTTDGGTSWIKISSWATSTTGFYVHADQHNIQWWDGGSKLLFGCDGGLHYSSNGGATNDHRNKGLRMKQFYSVAIHPNETNYFIAGAQDNGMHRLNHPGLDSSIEVYGGDGAYCAIDQDQPQYQFGSYVYNVYRRSVDNGANWSSITLSSTVGRFINPWDYDNAANIVYACYNSGTYLRWNNPQTGSSSDIVTATGFSGNVSAVHVSPYTANRVYFGMGSGGIQYVDNAHTGTTVTATSITPSGSSGYVSSVVTGSSDQNLLATYSSYGVNNVWVSTNGGASWTAIDGNLPDMPVRWALFHPDDNAKAFIATETGVWETDLINGSSTVWTANNSFPNVRTDMIKYRNSDRTIAAGTHGRGIFTTTVPSAAAPTVTINQAAGQPDPTSTSPINFTVVFSEPVTGFTTGDVTLSGTAGATTGTVTGSGATYNVAVSGMTGSGTVIATIMAGVAIGTVNMVGNAASTSTDNTVTYNAPAIPPTVTINQAAGQPDPTSTSPINFTVVFSEPVTGFTTGDVTLSGTAGATTGTVTGSGATYNVAVSGMTGSGTVIATIMAGVAIGTVNMVGNAASTSTDNTVTYNAPAIPPTVTINQAAGQPDPTSTSPINFTVVFSEPVTGFTTGDITLSGTAGATTGTVTGSGATYNVAVSGMTGSGTVIATIMAGVAIGTVNMVGNAASTSTDNTVTYNSPAIPPTVTINQAAGQLDPTSASPINFTVVFSEPVTGFTTGDVTLSGTAGATTGTVTGSGATYNVAVSGMTGTGTVIATIMASVATGTVNMVGNAASTSTDNTVTYNIIGGVPANDLCINALPISCGTTVSGTTVGATLDGVSFCGTSETSPSVWYSFTGNGDYVTLNTCTGTIYDSKISVYSGSCGALTCVVGNDDFCGLQSQVSFVSVSGTTYYVLVHGFGGQSGVFDLTMTCCAIPTVNTVANQTVCNSANTTAVNFSGSLPGTVYNWANDNTSIGLAANGTGNIASFVATNATNTAVTATITVTPTIAGCIDGPSKMFTITVNPTPSVNQPANQVLCNGAATAAVAFTGTVSGTVYNWTNSNPGIGLAANGVGDIPSFNAINTGAAPVVATINVTPQTGAPMAVAFSNSTNILIPATGTSGIANPYPSDIVVSGIPATGVTIQSITLSNITHTFSDDIEMLLVSPGGQTFVVMADVGGATGLDATATLTIRDGFPSMPLGSAPMPTGTYAPTSDGSAATWPAPAPTGPYNFPAPGGSSTFASVYNASTNYNGTWKLYVDDDAGGDIGNIAGGWSINLLVPSASNCIGASKSFTYTVNPTPNAVTTPSSQTLCANNTAITTIVISGAVSGTTYSWTRNNTATVTGIAASGTGNISGTLNNTTTAPITVTFTITPTANGCPGPTTTATVTVAPTIAVDPVANQTVCNGALTAPVNFTGPAAGTIFNWTNNTTSIGLAASGTGNIAAFTAMNATTLPVTATVTVTPSISVVSQPTPELFLYKFDGSGTSVPNLASTPPAGTTTATIIGAQTQGGSGICNGTLIGSGNSSTTNYVNTNWATNLTGTSWSLSFKTSNIQPSTTLFYIFGDNTANSFRCFTNGVAGSNNWMLRGPVGDIIVPGGATVAPHTTTFVYDNVAGQLRGYLDGVLVVTNAQAPPTISGTGPFKVGAYSGSTGLPTGGLMDEFRLYNRALTLSEIQSLSSCNTICTGPPRTFTITVNPTPTITCPVNMTVASDVGVCTKVVTYAPTVTGTPTPTLSYVLTGATTGSGTGTGSGTAFRVGVTTVTITATNICATVSCSFTVTVTDSQLPVITTAPANRTVCTGTNATFSVTAITAPSAGGPLSYQWQLWNGSTWNNIAGANASSYTVNGATLAMNTNSYRVVVTGLCTVVNSTHATLYVNPLPTINLTTSIPPNLLPTQVLTITATVAPGGGSFVWFKNGVVIAGASGPSLANLTVSDIGTYRAVYTGPNGCVITSSDVAITGQASDNLYVYPVPNNGQFNVRFYNQTNELVTLRVIDAKGSEVYRKKVQTTIPYTTINVDLSSNRILASGVYMVEMRRSDGSLAGSRKIIVYK